jgi:mRNA interferase MazF
MKEGDVILTQISQADGTLKNRPALILRELPPFQDFLACGSSTQIHQAVPGFDEIIARTDPDFVKSGLVVDSVVRLGFLAVLPRRKIAGTIGSVSGQRHERLLRRLSSYLLERVNKASGKRVDRKRSGK